MDSILFPTLFLFQKHIGVGNYALAQPFEKSIIYKWEEGQRGFLCAHMCARACAPLSPTHKLYNYQKRIRHLWITLLSMKLPKAFSSSFDWENKLR